MIGRVAGVPKKGAVGLKREERLGLERGFETGRGSGKE